MMRAFSSIRVRGLWGIVNSVDGALVDFVQFLPKRKDSLFAFGIGEILVEFSGFDLVSEELEVCDESFLTCHKKKLLIVKISIHRSLSKSEEKLAEVLLWSCAIGCEVVELFISYLEQEASYCLL